MTTVAGKDRAPSQTTNSLLMIIPEQFGFNTQTAETNSFQNRPQQKALELTTSRVLSEFWTAVSTIRRNNVNVVVAGSRKDTTTPDAVFPNNWISFHTEIPDYDVVLYPMMAPNRRAERQFHNVKNLLPWLNIDFVRVLDLTPHEVAGKYLEGTGSLILSRREKVVFTHDSPRASQDVLNVFCEETGYRAVQFHSVDSEEKPIYHTNVVMSIGDGFSVISLESIPDKFERKKVEQELGNLALEVVDITPAQVARFCGNILQVDSDTGQSKILMSQTAHDAFTDSQRSTLAKFGALMPINIPTIETVGGGSARCMVAEIFPGRK